MNRFEASVFFFLFEDVNLVVLHINVARVPDK